MSGLTETSKGTGRKEEGITTRAISRNVKQPSRKWPPPPALKASSAQMLRSPLRAGAGPGLPQAQKMPNGDLTSDW